MKTYKFYLESNKWYILLPEWDGPIEDLEMVMGADSMLDILAQGEREVNVTFSEEPFDGYQYILTYLQYNSGGANYLLTSDLFTFDIWLCKVTKFVFGHLPKKIYIK